MYADPTQFHPLTVPVYSYNLNKSLTVPVQKKNFFWYFLVFYYSIVLRFHNFKTDGPGSGLFRPTAS